MTFEQAFKRLQEIYQTLKNKDLVDIDMIVNLHTESKKLYEYCKDMLKKIPNNLQGDRQTDQ